MYDFGLALFNDHSGLACVVYGASRSSVNDFIVFHSIE